MTIGIYCIRNKINGKVYVGKSIAIEKRLLSHKSMLSKEHRDKDCNRYLFSSVKKYGIDNFEFIILEEHIYANEDYLKDREIFFMDLLKSCNSETGYNLRRDSSTKTVVHDDTRKLISAQNKGENNPNYGNRWTNEMKEKMSENKKQAIKNGDYDWMKTDEWRKKLSEVSRKSWLNTEVRESRIEKQAISSSVYRIYQYDKHTLELVAIWESMHEIIKSNPDYFKIAIYNVCSGNKKSYRGYVWRKELKVDGQTPCLKLGDLLA